LPNAKILRFGRVLRLVRILRLLRTLKFLRIILLFFRGMESFKELFDIKIMRKTLTYSFILIFIGSVSIVYFENQSGGVDSFINGLWWSFTTLVTGGFGDIHNPKTTGGMFITIILIIAGMVLIGVFIAGLSNVIQSNSENDDDYIEYFEKKFKELNNKIDKNKTEL
jgi:voltage-gated potassium channel